MRFVALTTCSQPDATLRLEQSQARRIGKMRLGTEHLFISSGLRVYYVPYREIHRYFRRVVSVPAKLCCGKGNLSMEHLVICGESGELAQVQLPGTRAAKAVMACMAQLAPDAAVGKPTQETNDA